MRIQCKTVYGIVGTEPKEKFVYEGGNRTEKPVLDAVTGLPVWGVTGLFYIPAADTFTDAAVRVPAKLAEQLAPGAVVILTGESQVADMRGGQFGSIAVTVAGVENVEVRTNFRDTVAAIETKGAAK